MRRFPLLLLSSMVVCPVTSCDDPVPAPSDGPVTDAIRDAGAESGSLEAGATDGSARQAVMIPFAARVGTLPFSCATTYRGLGADDSEVKPGDFRFYVQDVLLLDEQGRWVPVTLEADGRWQQSNVALLDFEDKREECANGTEPTNDRLIGSVPPGRYKGLKFVIGVPFELNHRPLTASRPPLDLTALFWSWNSGHLFLKAEASAVVTAPLAPADAGPADAGDAADAPAGPRRNVFALHAGSTLCEGKATEGALIECKHPNRGMVDLPEFQPGTSRVIVDFGAIFTDSQLQTQPGCHSFAGGDSCVSPFDRIGVDWITGRPTPGTQKVFRVE